MAKAGAGRASALSPDSISMPMALNASHYASPVMPPHAARCPTPKAATTTANAAAIAAIVAVVFHRAAMLCRPIFFSRRG